MQKFEYRVIPAPVRGDKSRGVKAAPDRFALTLTILMNELGQDGWEYLRADTLPCEERVGLTGSKTTFQNMLVFRRVVLAEPVHPVVRLAAIEQEPAAPRLLAVEPPAGTAPALGPANGGLAAE